MKCWCCNNELTPSPSPGLCSNCFLIKAKTLPAPVAAVSLALMVVAVTLMVCAIFGLGMPFGILGG